MNAHLSKSGLNAIVLACIAVHLMLVLFTKDSALIADCFMLWMGIKLIISSRNWTLNDRSLIPSPFRRLLTLITVGLLFGLSVILYGLQEQFLRLCPTILMVGFAVRYADKDNLKRIGCLILFSILIIPTRDSLSNISILVEPTARFVSALISIWIKNLYQSHDIIASGNQAIAISSQCSSLGTMRRVVSVGIWIALAQPKYYLGIFWIPLALSCYAFIANGLRIAALVALKLNGKDALFDFWHGGNGRFVLPFLPFFPLIFLFYKFAPSLKRDRQVLT